MYNLTVADAHTFLVGDGQWLVHNAKLCRTQYEVPLSKTSINIALGVDEHIQRFAYSIPKTYYYPEWPDHLVRISDQNLNPMYMIQGSYLENNLRTVLNRVGDGELLDGRIKFNLQGLTDPKKTSLTIVELEWVMRSGKLTDLTDFYHGIGNVLTGNTLNDELTRLGFGK